jgi:hypothetical protein
MNIVVVADIFRSELLPAEENLAVVPHQRADVSTLSQR